jgi:hypothetical protein
MGCGRSICIHSSRLNPARFAESVEHSSLAAAVGLFNAANANAVILASHSLSILPPPNPAPKKGLEPPAENPLKQLAVEKTSGI